MPNEPMIKLDPGGKAPILRYNIPESTSYSGRNFIELQFAAEYFDPAARQKPAEAKRLPVKNLDLPAIKAAVSTGMKGGFVDQRLFPNVVLSRGSLRLRDKSQTDVRADAGSIPVSPALNNLDPDEISIAMQAGKRLNIYRSMYGPLVHNYVPEPVEARPRLYLIETYQLSSFPGAFGVGRVVKSISLMPGEKTKISVKTFSKRESDEKSASSVLDSFTQESSDDFESSLQAEQSDKTSYNETFEYNAQADASASWGWGKANVAGGVKGGSNAAREEFAKSVSSALQKHSATASAKREVKVDSSYEVREQVGEETAIEREIENINLSRVLNLVFRQMNQEFYSLLHLVDVRVGFFNGFAESVVEAPISQLDGLLAKVVLPAKRAEVRVAILNHLLAVKDYKDDTLAVTEEKQFGDEKYVRIRKDLVSSFVDPVTKEVIASVPGVILSIQKTAMRTEGMIVEALLGEGEALDFYARQLQDLEVRKRAAETAKLVSESARADLINNFAKGKLADEAKILRELLLPCCDGKGDPGSGSI